MFSKKENQFLALGLYDPDSPIRVKVLSTINGTKLDQAWFTEKLGVASARRQTLLNGNTNAYRLCFGENDGLPSFICDVYDEVAVLKIYARIWFPFLEYIMNAVKAVTSCKAIILRLSRTVIKEKKDNTFTDGQIIYGTLESEEVIFTEHGVQFKANLIKGHKTGFFLDHRHNRHAVQQLAKDKRVLDVFSYAGGFAVHALVGGATAVSCVDISKQALQLAKANAALNNVEDKLEHLAGDAFKILKDLKQKNKKYDLVIIDPPAFAKAAKEVPTALEQYRRLAKLGVELVAYGGTLLLASCSSRVTADVFFKEIETALRQTGKDVTLTKKTFHDIDHPIGFPEGAYLKSGYYMV